MNLFYKEYGEGGHPLVVLHGLLGSSGNWHTLASKAFAPHFHVYTLDQRNHGRSPHDDRFDYEAMVDDLEGFAERQKLASLFLLGHSMGGKTAMHYALAHPYRVERLVVADIAPRAYPDRHTPIFEALRAVDPAQYDSRRAIDRALAQHIAAVPVRQFLLKNLAHDGQGGYRWQPNLEAIHAGYPALNTALPDGPTFDRPTLFIRGAQSDYITDADEAELHRHFPQAEVVTIPGAGHWVHADAPRAFAEVVVRFLQGG